jgi:hypothetical protein
MCPVMPVSYDFSIRLRQLQSWQTGRLIGDVIKLSIFLIYEMEKLVRGVVLGKSFHHSLIFMRKDSSLNVYI